ncbi:hypothetical protein LIER_42733 [Lithospermum erythrorhizon]|uniref:DUF4283 domain-containing protein n=1 Tax=Lithospermum erythrorhizon TaxID=34254 RepID=A0AAV3NUS2_LITER
MEDYTRLWVRLIWYVQSYPMRIFKWTPDFNTSKESRLAPIWVHLHGLLLYLFEWEALLSVANSIGTRLRIDSHNVNRVKLGTSSVSVELDVSKPLMNETWISFVDDEDPTIVVDGFWSKCFHMEHKVDDCKCDFEKEQGKGPQAPYVHRRRQYRRVVNPTKAVQSKGVVNDVKKKGTLDPLYKKNNGQENETKEGVQTNNSSAGLENVCEEEKAIAEDAKGNSMDIEVTVGKDTIHTIVQTNNTFVGLENVIEEENDDALLLSDPADLHKDGGDHHVGENGFEVHQCGEIVDQSGDMKVEIAAIDLTEINVPFHMDSAPSSPKYPERLNITCSESVAPEENHALVEDMAEQHIDKSPEPFPHVE